MKHFLVTSWPVFLYLCYTSLVGQPMSIGQCCQNRTSTAISRQQGDPSSGAIEKTVFGAREPRGGRAGKPNRGEDPP